MRLVLFGRLLLVGGLCLSSPALAEGDPEKGKRLYNRCKSCHVLDAETNRAGPHLLGLFGRRAGAVEGYNYSQAMKDSGIVWDDATLDAFLADPRGYVKGTRMAFAGLRNPEQRADLIAYMKEAGAGD